MRRTTDRRGRARRPRSCELERGTPCLRGGGLGGVSASSLPLERVLGLLDEAVALALYRRPGLGADEVCEGKDRVSARVDVGDDLLLDVVELGMFLREPAAARAVREHAIVELVGRADAALLERGRDSGHPVRERRLLPVHARGGVRGMPVAYLTGRDAGDRLLRVPRLARAAACALLEPQRRAVLLVRARRARGEGFRRPPQPGAEGRPAALGGGRRSRPQESPRARGGYGGDFATVLGSLRRANSADVASTVDTVGIPLMLLRRAGRLRPPLVYVAIGLPERLVQLRSERMRRLYASALGSCASVIAYSQHEADELRTGWPGTASRLGSSSSRSVSMPKLSGPAAGLRRSTSFPSAPTRIATSRCSTRCGASAGRRLPDRHQS